MGGGGGMGRRRGRGHIERGHEERKREMGCSLFTTLFYF